jgi:hypothetical protein
MDKNPSEKDRSLASLEDEFFISKLRSDHSLYESVQELELQVTQLKILSQIEAKSKEVYNFLDGGSITDINSDKTVDNSIVSLNKLIDKIPEGQANQTLKSIRARITAFIIISELASSRVHGPAFVKRSTLMDDVSYILDLGDFELLASTMSELIDDYLPDEDNKNH